MALGFGKVILFGEHFVVHGVPAIAASIANKTEITIISELPEQEIKIIDQHENTDKVKKIVEAILQELKINKGLSFAVESDIPPGAGMGSSAAFSAATVRAISEYFGMKLTDEETARVATVGENVIHINSSGLDPTIASVGGIIWFKRNLEGGKPLIKQIANPSPLPIVIANSGKKSDTGEMVKGVAERKEKFAKQYDPVFNTASQISENARIALENNNHKEIGNLMDANHSLLIAIDVSTPELNEMVQTAKDAGALGAKLSGAGGGGIIIALCPGKQEEVSEALKKKGYNTIITQLGVKH